jgi:hypothetical protein
LRCESAASGIDVDGAGFDFEHHLSGKEMQLVPVGGQGFDQCSRRRLGSRGHAVVQRQSSPFILQQRAVVPVNKVPQLRSNTLQRVRHIRNVQGTLRIAPLQTVQSTNGQPQRVEDAVEIVDSTAADQSKCPAEAKFESTQHVR